jgi:hypothetical protein
MPPALRAAPSLQQRVEQRRLNPQRPHAITEQTCEGRFSVTRTVPPPSQI